MNDILEIINDLKEVREAVVNIKSFFIEIDRKIEKYQMSNLGFYFLRFFFQYLIKK